MPFTFSHPAIVLPLTKFSGKWLSTTALIVGSCTPDFEYFIRMKMLGALGHSWEGILWFNIPVGLALCFTWHLWVAGPLLAHLPWGLSKKLSSLSQPTWLEYFKTRWWVVLYSLALGTASHILWDGLTHRDGLFVTSIPALQHIWHIGSFPVPVFSILQHSSTILGAFCIVWFLSRLPSQAAITPTDSKYWVVVFIVSLITILIRGYFLERPWYYGDVIATMIAAGLIGVVLAPIIRRKQSK